MKMQDLKNHELRSLYHAAQNQARKQEGTNLEEYWQTKADQAQQILADRMGLDEAIDYTDIKHPTVDEFQTFLREIHRALAEKQVSGLIEKVEEWIDLDWMPSK